MTPATRLYSKHVRRLTDVDHILSSTDASTCDYSLCDKRLDYLQSLLETRRDVSHDAGKMQVSKLLKKLGQTMAFRFLENSEKSEKLRTVHYY